jgi:hypothetical protein
MLFFARFRDLLTVRGAQASLPACFGQSALAGSPQARMPAFPGDFSLFLGFGTPHEGSYGKDVSQQSG